jgi:hypothetical protein
MDDTEHSYTFGQKLLNMKDIWPYRVILTQNVLH